MLLFSAVHTTTNKPREAPDMAQRTKLRSGPMATPTSWTLNATSDTTRQRPKSFTIGRMQKSDGPIRNVASSKHPDIMGLAFKVVDIYGSTTAKMPVHKPWRGKMPELDDWTTRPGYGMVPAYLASRPMRTSASLGSLGAASSLRSSRGALSSTNSRRPGSAGSQLSLGRGMSASGADLHFSNATVRLIEHPLQWKLHKNGVNVRSSPPPSSYSQQQGQGRQTPPRPRTASALTSSQRSLRTIGSAGTSRLTRSALAVSFPESRDELATTIDLTFQRKRPSSASPLCTTYGLSPNFPRAGPDLQTFERPMTADSTTTLIRKNGTKTSAPAPGVIQWRNGGRPYPQDGALRNDRERNLRTENEVDELY